MFVIRLGGNLAKLVASAVTPLLCATSLGWRAVCYAYGGGLLAYCALWQAVARNAPPPLPSADSPSAAGSTAPKKKSGTGEEFRLAGLVTKPAAAIVAIQVAHALCEFNIVAAWAPTYFSEVLGVPLSRLGFFTSVPMIVRPHLPCLQTQTSPPTCRPNPRHSPNSPAPTCRGLIAAFGGRLGSLPSL